MFNWCCRNDDEEASGNAVVLNGVKDGGRHSGRPDVEVWIDKGSKSAALGIAMDLTGSGLAYIGRVIPDGPVDKHNQKQDTHHRIRQGDYVGCVRALDTTSGPLMSMVRQQSASGKARPESGSLAQRRGARAVQHLVSGGGRPKGRHESDSDGSADEEESVQTVLSPTTNRRIALIWVAGEEGHDARALLRTIHSYHILQLEVQKPIIWTAVIQRTAANETLGLQTIYTDGGAGLVVDAIVGGAVQRWNEGNPGRAIQKNDRLLSVNYQGNAPRVLMEVLSSPGHEELTLVVSRPSSG